MSVVEDVKTQSLLLPPRLASLMNTSLWNHKAKGALFLLSCFWSWWFFFFFFHHSNRKVIKYRNQRESGNRFVLSSDEVPIHVSNQEPAGKWEPVPALRGHCVGENRG